MNRYEQHLADLERQREVVRVANDAVAATRAWAEEQRETLYAMLEEFPVLEPWRVPCHCPGVYSQDYENGSYGPLYESGRDWSPDCPAHGLDKPSRT